MKNDVLPANLSASALFIASLIKEYSNNDNYTWLQQKAESIIATNDLLQAQHCFAAIPRKIEKKIIHLTTHQQAELNLLLPGLFVDAWSLHRLCRMYILMQINGDEKELYCKMIEGLLVNAEMNERADLYAALPLFRYPEYWVKICVEGIRSNMGVVLEAIMYNNPYPEKYLETAAWNQMVLKAFFTEKDINRITGLDKRANVLLANTLIDYARERMAAKRTVNVQLWRLVGKFINDSNYTIIESLFSGTDKNTLQAAALACYASEYKPAQQLLNSVPDVKLKIIENKLNWGNIGSNDV